jgi:ABC-type phosphate transport system substrate-binding protein
MDMSLQKRSDPRPLAALVGLVLGCCLLASLAFAGAASANVPESGLNCVEASGKISGRGSTYQNNLQEELAKGYRDDFCGTTGTETAENKVGGTGRGEAGGTMVAYNDPEAEKNGVTGSGAGLKDASCRIDAFAGTDLPYNLKQLEELDQKPGTLLETEDKGTGKPTCTETVAAKYKPPFQPNIPEVWPDTKAGEEDTTANLMSFPIGGSSVALPVHLTAENCGGKAENVPTGLEFTAKEVSRIFGGDASNWNDTELVKNNPALANCTAPIVRIVRFDNSGTTSIFKSYLIRAENTGVEQAGVRTTFATCATTKPWSAAEFSESPNTKWPGLPTVEGTCSKIETAGKSGGPALVTKLKETSGGIGYADLANATGTEGEGLILPTVKNQLGTAAKAPNAGKAANCTYSVVSLPGATAEESVGLNPKDNWANNNNTNPGAPENHYNTTDLGSLYPICGLTFDLVYTGLSNTKGGNNPISRLTANQRRTLYSYMTYLLSSTAQDKLGTFEYASLPTSWLPTLRKGFQKEF